MTTLPNPHRVKFAIWDMPTRAFHWLLVIAIATAAVSGFLLNASWLALHIVGGAAAGTLVLFRIIWGFAGSTHSRFASFWPRPRQVIEHLRSLSRRDSEPHAGHNPLGALMVIVLLALVLALSASGFLVLGGVLKQGPFKAALDFTTADIFRELHEIAAWTLLVLVVGHLAGVVFESLRAKDNLARAMVTGQKLLPASAMEDAQEKSARSVATVIASAALAAMIGGFAWIGINQKPPGVPDQPLDAAYVEACGDCHTPFHPSLLPAAKWQSIMTSLDDHFGEDATLDATTATALSAYLMANASEKWDTLPAHVLAANTSNEPLRITTSGFWQWRHAGIDKAVFESKVVKTKTNCEACHKDARAGLFAPQSISIPKEITP